MSLDETGLLVKLEANINQWEKNFNRAIAQQQRASQRMEQIAKQNAKKIGDAYKGLGGNIGASFSKLAGPLAGGLSAAIVARQVQNYAELADAATQMRNSLRVAGLEGDELSSVYGKLYQSAQRNAAPISSLVDLYSKLSLTQKELGVSSDELIRFTDGIAVALKVAGTDANTASGSLLQLSQALGGGVVRAEEFNSILEGTPTIAQAVARGLKEAGGSVAELRKLVVDGKVSSAAFFRSFEAGSVVLRQQAETTQSTTKQAFTRLGNSLVTVVGEFDRASGASAGFADAIDDLSDGLDSFDAEGFVSKVQRIIDIISNAEEAGTKWLNGIGNSDFFKNLNEALGITDESGKVLNPDVSEAKAKIASLEGDIDTLQASIESNTSLGFDNTDAIARLREVRNELAALRAEAANLPKYSTNPMLNPVNTDTGTFFDGRDYAPPSPAAPESAKPVSIEDHPAAGSGGSKGGGYKGKGGGKGGGGASREKLDDFEREAKSIRERTALMQIQSQVYASLTGATDQYGDAVEFAETKASLLAAAQKAGKEITPALTADIDALAQSYVTASKKADQAAEAMKKIEDAGQKGAETLAGMFTDILSGSKSADEAFSDLLKQIANAQLQKMFTNMFSGEGAGGCVAKWLGGLLGFAEGGFTGPGTKYQPAGVVHAGEYVFSAETVNKIGAGNLEQLHRAAKSGATGYARGGMVGGTAKLSRVSGAPSKAAAGNVQNISLAPTINLTASGGTPEQNANLAKQVSAQTEAAMRNLVRDELVRQRRPGGMMR